LKGFEEIAVKLKKTGKFLVNDILSAPSSYSEAATRGAVYVKARKSGKGMMPALKDAAESSGSFYKIGTWKVGTLLPAVRGTRLDIDFQGIIRTIPFFNPGTQIVANTIQAFGDKKRRGKALFVAAIYMALGLAAAGILGRKGTEKQKRSFASLPPAMLSMYLFFPHPNGSDLIKIRTNPSFSIPANIVNMLIFDAVYKPEEKQYEGADYLDVATGFIPDQFNVFSLSRMFLSWLPHPSSVFAGIFFNVRTWPEVSDLEPEYMEHIAPEERKFDSTSEVAKWVGKLLKISPIKMDYGVEGFLGRSSRYAMFKKSVFNPIEELFIHKYSIYRSKTLNELKDRGHELDNEIRKYRKGDSDLSADEVIKLRAEKKAINEVDKLVSTYSDLVSEEKEEEAEALIPEIFEKMDAAKQGKSELSDDAYKDLENEYKKLVKAEKIYSEGYPEVLYWAFTETNEKRKRVLTAMYEQDPKRAEKFYKALDEAGLLSSQFKKLYWEK